MGQYGEKIKCTLKWDVPLNKCVTSVSLRVQKWQATQRIMLSQHGFGKIRGEIEADFF